LEASHRLALKYSSMDSKRWQDIQSLFDAAADLSPSDRAALLDRNCADAAIRQEVETLLENAELAESYFEVSVGSLAGRIVEASVEPAPDQRLGAYRIIRRIGQGGMQRRLLRAWAGFYPAQLQRPHTITSL